MTTTFKSIRSRHATLVEDTQHAAHVRRARARRGQAADTRTGWILLAIVLCLTGLVAVVAIGRGPENVQAATRDFAEAWTASDVKGLVRRFHPDGRTQFRAQIERIAANRGWQAGFPAIASNAAIAAEGAGAEPGQTTAQSMLSYAGGGVRIFWQYEPGHSRWYAYDVCVTLPALAPRLDAFRAAWQKSDPQALHEFFRRGHEDRMVALVARRAKAAGWASSFPVLGEATITGEEEVRHPGLVDRPLGQRVESTFYIDDRRELVVRWVFDREYDSWHAASFRFW